MAGTGLKSDWHSLARDQGPRLKSNLARHWNSNSVYLVPVNIVFACGTWLRRRP
jgi:hypothetical protein